MSLLKTNFFNRNWLKLFSTLPTIDSHSFSLKKNVKLRQDLLIIKLINSKAKVNNDKWLDARNDLLKNSSTVTTVNVDSIIIDLCFGAENVQAAYDYFKFLKKQNIEFNLSIILKYFKILAAKDKLTKNELNDISNLYDELRKKYPVVNRDVNELCVDVLCCTDRWRESEQLLNHDDISISECSSTSYYSIAAAAFDHDEYQLGWLYLTKKIAISSPNAKVYQSYLRYIQRHSKDKQQMTEYLEKLFQLWLDYEIYPPENMMDYFINFIQQYQIYKAEKCQVKHSGICTNCQRKLLKLELNPEDFNYLTESVKSKVLLGQDVYLNSTPKEIINFQSFVDSTKPYDVVIDGLNAAYTLGRANNNKRHSCMLVEAIKPFLQQRKVVALIGRKHMTRWPTKDMDFVKKYTHMFLASDLSKDDGFLLYATLSSGIDTYFVSQDLMRQHKFILLDPKLQRIFNRWQLSRQIFPFYRIDQGATLVYPPQATPIAQKDSNGWHIPWESSKIKEKCKHDFPQSWLCLKKIS